MNKKIGLGIVGVIVLIGVFYGGMVYGKSQIPARGQGMQAFGQNNALGARGGTRNVGGFTAGQIIAKDANSITVQLMASGPDSTTQVGSKIVFLSTSTTVTKSVNGTIADLAIGAQVSITGTPNTDGSVNAQAVQIRPQTMVK